MVDLVSTNRVHVTCILTESTIPVRDVVLIPGLLPIFLHGSEIKSGRDLGTRLKARYAKNSLFLYNNIIPSIRGYSLIC